jgi:O-antigen/teichoic acid export membrane protein
MAAVLVDFGSGVWVSREVAAKGQTRVPWSTNLLFGALTVVFGVGVVRLEILEGSDVVWSCCCATVMAGSMLGRGFLWGLKLHHVEAGAAALETGLLVLVVLALLAIGGGPSLVDPIEIAVVCYAIGLAIRLRVVLKCEALHSGKRVSISELAPYGLQALVTKAGTQLDVVLLALLAPSAAAGEVGGYALALRAYYSAAIPMEALASALLPRLVESVRPFLGLFRKAWLYGGLWTVATIAAFQWVATSLPISDEVATAASRALTILILAGGIRCGAHLMGALVTAQGKQRERLLASAASLIVMLVLQVTLIPTFGLVGAAWALVAGDIVLVAGYSLSTARIIRASKATDKGNEDADCA